MAKKGTKTTRRMYIDEVRKRTRQMFLADMINSKDTEAIHRILDRAAKKL